MLNDLYNTKILDLSASIPHLGRLDAPMASSTKHSRLCGSVVTVDLDVDTEGRVSRFSQEVKACALGQASASVLGGFITGASLDEVRAARDALKAMLKEDGPPVTGRFGDLAFLEPVKDYKARHASTMLAFDAATEAMEAARAAKTDTAPAA